jgi:hypothetical protein
VLANIEGQVQAVRQIRKRVGRVRRPAKSRRGAVRK